MKIQSTRTMTTAFSQNRNQFTMRSALAVCFLLSCIMSLQGFAATYYWVGANRTDWNTLASWKDIDGVSQTSWSDTNTYVIDVTQEVGSGTGTLIADTITATFPANNLTIKGNSSLVMDKATNSVDTLTLSGATLWNFESPLKIWGDGTNDKIVLMDGTNQVAEGTSGGAITINAFIEGSGNLLLRPKSATRYMQLNKANTHTGTTTMRADGGSASTTDGSGGTLIIANANALQNSTLNLRYDSASEGTVTFNQNSTLGGLEDSSVAANLNLNGRTISIGYDDSARDKTFDGNISNGEIIKFGSSTQRFKGAVIVPVTVTGGTVVMSGTFSGGTIDLAGGNLNIGSDTVAGETMSFTTLTLADGSTITWQVDGALGDTLSSSNDLVLGGLSAGGVTINVDNIGAAPVIGKWYTLFNGNVNDFGTGSMFTFSGYKANKWSIREGSLEIMLIPEPSTAILAGLGLAGMCLRRRKRT